MWRVWFQQSDWFRLLELATPRLLEVVPAFSLSKQIGELATNYVNTDKQARVRQQLGDLLVRARIGVALDVSRVSPADGRVDRGQALLKLFFLQLFGSSDALLDLRHKRFREVSGGWLWSPAPWYLRWAPAFLGPLRELYSSFYDGDDVGFRRALSELGILAAERPFREHFGAEDQCAVTFSLRSFRETFREILLVCSSSGASLHANFIGFGISLACLYEHMERIGGAHDVRRAFGIGRAAARAPDVKL